MAENTKPMQVGRIPSLTWNRLKVNYANVQGDYGVQADVVTTFEGLPEGITKKELSSEEAAGWLKEHAPAEKPEAVVAGKEPIYHPQAFGTGLGKEYDDFVEKSVQKVNLFETADGAELEKPILWDMHFEDGAKAVSENLIHVGKNSTLTLIMTAESEKKAGGTAALSTKVLLEEGAKLHLIKVQMLGDAFLVMDDLGGTLADRAQFSLTQLSLGGKEVYIGTQPELVGNASKLDVKMGYLVTRDESAYVNVNAVQRGRKTTVEMHFDGVLDGTARKNFCGTIDFRKGSKGSKGNEQENVLLLSDDIVNKTLPVILCEEEDVEGRHGASIGKLDEDMLFYMASRGIDEKTAEQIMVRARLHAVAADIPDQKLRDKITDFVEEAVTA